VTCLLLVAASVRAGAAADEGMPTPADWLEQVRNGTRREKLEALDGLGGIRDAGTLRQWGIVEALLEGTLDDKENPLVRWKIVITLGNIARGLQRDAKEQIRDPLIKVLKSRGAHTLVRVEAARQLGRIATADQFEDRTIVNELTGASSPSRGTPPEVAAAALKALGSIGDPRAREAIRNAMNHRDPMINEAALEALEAALSGPRAAEFVDPAMSGFLVRLASKKDISPEKRESIFKSMGLLIRQGIKIPSAEGLLVKVLREEERVSTVKMAIQAVGLMGTPGAAKALGDVYKRFGPPKDATATDEGADVRAQVCVTIGDIFDVWAKKGPAGAASAGSVRSLVDVLANALIHDQNDRVKIEAAISLGNLYDRRYDRTKAVEVLIAVLGAKNVGQELKKRTAESLQLITGRLFGDDVDRWERWYKENKHTLGAGRR
jgi:hypothetical protein